MMKKSFSFTALMALALVASTAVAKEYKIPATQEDFDAQWQIVSGQVDGTWTWVDGATPYATTPDVADGEVGATLVYGTPFSMKAGDTWYLQAKVSSDHYNNDEFFYIVYGTDINNLKPMSTSSANDFKCWGKSGGGVNFTTKPSDTSSSRVLKIEQDGEYYVGVRSWKYNSASKRGEMCVASLFVEKSVDYPDRVTGGKAVALEGKLGSTLTWTWPTKTKNGKAIEGELSAKIYRSTSDSKAVLYTEENFIGTVTGGVAGTKGTWVDDPETSIKPITEPGKYYYYVAPVNDQGENSECASAAVFSCKWVGEEMEFLPILNSSYYPVAATMIDESSVSISFTPRKEAKNGGWFEEDKVMLKVTRQLGKNEPVVITENAPMVSPFVDNTLTDPGTYTYYLYVVYKGNESSSTKVDPLYAGGTLPLPFTADFAESNSMDLFTVVGTNSSYKWNRSYSGYLQFNSYSSGNTSTVLTPPVKVEVGKTYHISCLSWAGNTSTTKELEIVVGPSASNLATVSKFTIDVTTNNKKTCEAFYAPDETGIVNFGFRAEGSTNYIYLDDILIEETVPAPAAVADLTATPDTEGALKATVVFTVPATTNAGQVLTSLNSVTVSRIAGEETMVIKTFTGDDCGPGTPVSIVDNVPEAGMYAYEVVSLLGENESDKATTEAVWVGYDVPKQVSSFQIRADLNAKGGADVKWSALTGTTLGTHGGYVDAANLRYRIYRIPTLFDKEPVVAGETTEVTFEDSLLADAEWNKYRYAISVINGTQESALSEGNSIAGGLVDVDNYTPDFTDKSFVEALEGRAFESNNDMLAFRNRGVTEGKEYMVFLPVFKAWGELAQEYEVTMHLSRGDAEYQELLEVFLCTVELTTPGIKDVNPVSNTEAAVILGSENRTLVASIPVTATFDSPAVETHRFTIPGDGRFRLALRCASTDNKLLSVHGLTLAADRTTSGVDVVTIVGNGVTLGKDGQLMLPEDTRSYAVYRVDGTMVASGNGNDAPALVGGLYLIHVIKHDGSKVVAKLAK